MHRSPMITVTRGRFGPAGARVLEQVRAGGILSRDEIAGRCGLSAATVGRTVGQLVDAGVLRERPDRARAGAVGRPGVPVEVDPATYVTVGVHVGRRTSTVALGDLTGRVVAEETSSRPAGAAPDLDSLSRAAADLLGGLPGRAPLAAGLVGPWRELGVDPVASGAALHELTGLDVRTADHIAAVAATEYVHRRQGTVGVTLYVYARDTVGFAVAVDKGAQTEVSRVGSLTHFPTGSGVRCDCGRSGCLETTLGHLADRDGDRARVLGEVAAAVRDMVAPDRVVLVGQAFTGRPAVLEDIVDAFRAATALGPCPVSFTRFGSGIQAAAACTVALGIVYDDPLAVVPSLLRRRTDPAGA